MSGVNLKLIKHCCNSNRKENYKKFKLKKKRGGYSTFLFFEKKNPRLCIYYKSI